MQKVCYWRDGNEVHSRWVRLEVELTANRIPLPPYDCGEAFSFPSYPCDSLDLITDSAAQFTVIYIGGIPIEVETNVISIEPALSWTGTGIATLPFATSAVRVEWFDVKINSDSNICDGVVYGIQDDPGCHLGL